MYCDNLDFYLEQLPRVGAVKLPSVKDASWRSRTYDQCMKELGVKSYGENLQANLEFLRHSSIITDLLPKLVELAKQQLNVNVSPNDVYNVCRLVRPGDASEGYRGHFDSHLFTLVTPLNIPNFSNVRNGGQLHYFPMARKQPRNEIQNIFGKVAYKRYNSETGFEKLATKTVRKIDDFQDYCPLLFMGNTTFHGNSPIQANSTENRMTILTHFFDPSPRYGLGAVMRKIRRR
jgi:hypothetical protein